MLMPILERHEGYRGRDAMLRPSFLLFFFFRMTAHTPGIAGGGNMQADSSWRLCKKMLALDQMMNEEKAAYSMIKPS